VIAMASESPVPMPPLEGKPTAYVCSNFACNLPVTDLTQLGELLE
jgi:uncharacterized protein YyaL (SSP411 family)